RGGGSHVQIEEDLGGGNGTELHRALDHVLLEDGIERKRLFVVVAGAVVEMKAGTVQLDGDGVVMAVLGRAGRDVGEGIAVQRVVDDVGDSSLVVVGVADNATGLVGNRLFLEGTLRSPEECPRFLEGVHLSRGGPFLVYAFWVEGIDSDLLL